MDQPTAPTPDDVQLRHIGSTNTPQSDDHEEHLADLFYQLDMDICPDTRTRGRIQPIGPLAFHKTTTILQPFPIQQ
jgi:hypothetical protein